MRVKDVRVGVFTGAEGSILGSREYWCNMRR